MSQFMSQEQAKEFYNKNKSIRPWMSNLQSRVEGIFWTGYINDRTGGYEHFYNAFLFREGTEEEWENAKKRANEARNNDFIKSFYLTQEWPITSKICNNLDFLYKKVIKFKEISRESQIGILNEIETLKDKILGVKKSKIYLSPAFEWEKEFYWEGNCYEEKDDIKIKSDSIFPGFESLSSRIKKIDEILKNDSNKKCLEKKLEEVMSQGEDISPESDKITEYAAEVFARELSSGKVELPYMEPLLEELNEFYKKVELSLEIKGNERRELLLGIQALKDEVLEKE